MTTLYQIVRHPHRGGKGGRPYLPAYDHPAIVEGRTIFGSTLRSADSPGALLKSGHNNGKTGGIVTKGRWKGMPIFTLTLEERSTCPRSCRLWRACMGNSMHLAQRWRHGADLELFLEAELRMLARRHRRGFVVRLHVLGDFYSPAYVDLWQRMMIDLPALRVFGFTARIDPADPITRGLAALRRAAPDRWFVRFSGALMERMAAEVVDEPSHATTGAIVCPQQTGRTLACGTCGLCWATNKNIAFLRH